MKRATRFRRALATHLPQPARRLARRIVGSAAPGAGRGDLVGEPESDAWFRVDPALETVPRLNVLLPHLEAARMTGGPNTALQLTARLAAAGVAIRCIATHGPLDVDDGGLRAHIRTLTGIDIPDDRLDFVRLARTNDPGGATRIGGRDAFLATWWRTAWVARAGIAATGAASFLYLVQDFEPAFYPWSSSYAQALATYTLPCRAIVNESLLAAHFVNDRIGLFGADGSTATPQGAGGDRRWVSFEPAVDPRVFAPGPARSGGRPRLLFYARPKNDRNLFDLGIRALRRAAASGALDSWECRSIGSDVPSVRLGERVVLEPQAWLDYRGYGRLLAESDLLVSLMLSPHTSYPPLEMAATGGRVVTNTFGPKSAEALLALSPLIAAAEPSVVALASAIERAVTTGPAPGGPRERRLAMPASWDEAFAPILPWVLDALGGRLAGLIAIRPPGAGTPAD